MVCVWVELIGSLILEEITVVITTRWHHYHQSCLPTFLNKMPDPQTKFGMLNWQGNPLNMCFYIRNTDYFLEQKHQIIWLPFWFSALNQWINSVAIRSFWRHMSQYLPLTTPTNNLIIYHRDVWGSLTG